MSATMPIHLDKKGDVDIVAVEGNLDFPGTEDLSAELHRLLAGGGRHLVFDCSQLVYVGSTGLRIFVLALKEMKPKGGRVLIAGLNGHIQSIFSMVGFLDLFEIFPTREAALAAV